MPPDLPLPALALALVVVLLWSRTRSRGDPSRLARAAELSRYRQLVLRAGSLLDQGRLTDAKGLIDEDLRQLRREARREERSRYIASEVRQLVWERDGGACLRCGSEEDLQFDHIIPWSKGGGNGPENIELLCGSCNREKAARVE